MSNYPDDMNWQAFDRVYGTDNTLEASDKAQYDDDAIEALVKSVLDQVAKLESTLNYNADHHFGKEYDAGIIRESIKNYFASLTRRDHSRDHNYLGLLCQPTELQKWIASDHVTQCLKRMDDEESEAL